MHLHNNERYKGQWIKNKKHGQGSYYYANGDHYKGNWFDALTVGLMMPEMVLASNTSLMEGGTEGNSRVI